MFDNNNIPNTWEFVNLGDITSYTKGYAFKSINYTSEGTRVIRISDTNAHSIKDDNPIFIKNKDEKYNKWKLKENDLVFTTVGSKPPMYDSMVGKVIKVQRKDEGALLNQNAVILRSLEGKVNQHYLFHNFKLKKYLNFIETIVRGNANQVSITLKELFNYKISLPPLKEQQKIAQILSQWDEAIETTQNLIEQLQLRKKGLMQELLSGKKRLAGFSEEWEEFQFGELLQDVKRPVKWDDKELYDLISVRRRSGGLFFRESLYGNQILTKNLKTAKSGDFLISKMQIVHGASGLVTKEFNNAKISGSYLSLRVIDENKTDINFINWLSKTPYFYYQTLISSYGVHIEKMTFNFKLFLKSKTRLPSIIEQRKIVEILESAQSEIIHQEDKLKQLKVSKKGLMQQLLTGKKRVKI